MTENNIDHRRQEVQQIVTLSGRQLDALQHKTFFGMEIKPLTYLLGSMNMILHGIEGANLELANTLEVHSHNVAEKDKYPVVLANPPYGGKMAQELQTNFRVRSGATECLFLQHIMANLAKGGRAGVVIPEGVLFRGGPDQKVRKELLEQFKLHTMGREPAAIALAIVSTKDPGHFRTTPGGYFHGMVAKAKAGELNLDRTLWAMRRAIDPKPRSQAARGDSGHRLPGRTWT